MKQIVTILLFFIGVTGSATAAMIQRRSKML